MSEYYHLTVESRENTGTSEAKALRRNGKIPANYYYKGTDNINLSINERDLYHALHSGQHIFEVTLGDETQYMMIKDIQYHPVTDEVIHVDLMRVRRDQKMTITVPLHMEGDAVGVKEGGVLTQLITNIDIECLPTDVPDYIVLDISDLQMNGSLTVENLPIDSHLTILTEADQVIAMCQPPKEEVEVEAEEEVEIEAGEDTDETKAEGDSETEESTE